MIESLQTTVLRWTTLRLELRTMTQRGTSTSLQSPIKDISSLPTATTAVSITAPSAEDTLSGRLVPGVAILMPNSTGITFPS